MLDKLYGGILRARWILIPLFVAVTVVYMDAAGKLVPDSSPDRVMLEHDPERLLNNEARELFGLDEVMVIAIPEEGGIYQPAYLEKIDRLTQAIEKLGLVKRVYSLTNYEVITGDNGELKFPKVTEKLKEGWTLDHLREFALQDPFLHRNVVSDDGKISAINVRLHNVTGVEIIPKKKELITEVRKLLDAEVGAGNYRLAGWPPVQVDMANVMEKDLGTLLPLAFLVITVLLIFAFGRPAGVILPLLGVVMSLMATMGNLGLAGTTLSMMTNALPLMVIAVASTFGIYMMTAIFQALEKEKDRKLAVRHALEHTAPGIFLSAVTTAIGFLSLTLNGVEAINEFGLFAAAGVMCTAAVCIVFIPALASVLPLRSRPPSKVAIVGRVFHPVKLLPALLSRGGRSVATVTTLVMIVTSIYGITRMRIESDPIAWFPKTSDTYQTTQYVNKHLAGLTPYSIIIEVKDEGGLQEPAVLAKVDALQQWLAAREDVDTTLTFVDYLKLMTQALHDGDPAQRRIPATRPEVAQTMLLYESDGLDSLVTKDYRKANLWLRSKLMASEEGVKFAKDVNEYLRAHFGDSGVTARITGTAYLAYKSQLELTGGLAQSLAMSIGLISIAMIFVARSIRLGLLALVPNVLPIAVNYAILGWTGLTLNSGTSITGCIAMGMAVDDTIHFITTFRDKLRETRDIKTALDLAMRAVGQPMLVNAFVLSLGFSAFMLSGFEPITVLGMLVTVTMGVAVACELLLMPNLLMAAGPWLLKGLPADPAQAASNVVHVEPQGAPQAQQGEGKSSSAGGAKMLVVLLGLGCLLAPERAFAGELTAQEIANRLVDVGSTGIKQGSADMRLVLQPDGGQKRERRYQLRTLDEGGKSKTLVRFLAPADVQGSAFLLIEHGEGTEDELFVYLPALKRTRRISGAQKSGAFMGSDVTYADLSFEDLKNSTHQKQPDATLDGVACYQITSTPKNMERYSKIETWVRKDSFLMQQMKIYDKAGNLLKILKTHEAKSVDGKWVVTQSQVWDKQKKHSTFFFVDAVDLKTAQNSGDYTPERMASN